MPCRTAPRRVQVEQTKAKQSKRSRDCNIAAGSPYNIAVCTAQRTKVSPVTFIGALDNDDTDDTDDNAARTIFQYSFAYL